MMRVEHYFFGFIVGLLCTILGLVEGGGLFALMCIPVAMMASILPDILDPPGVALIGGGISPWYHRSIAHSLIGVFVMIVSSFIAFILSFWLSLFVIPLSFTLGILSHQLADLTTPAGLPLFISGSLFGVIAIPATMIPVLNIAISIFNHL